MRVDKIVRETYVDSFIERANITKELEEKLKKIKNLDLRTATVLAISMILIDTLPVERRYDVAENLYCYYRYLKERGD